MTEEIEIEEHNLFESPVVKNLFPDLHVLKREIVFPSEDYYAEPESTCSVVTTNDYEYNIKVENTEPEDDVEYLSDTEVVNYNEPALEHINRYQPSQSKFILGTKPELLENTIEKLQARLMRMNLVIKDIEPYLIRSKRFCSKCLILFSDNSKINTHNLEFHKTDKAHGVKQNQRHARSLDRKSINLDEIFFTNNDPNRIGKAKIKRIIKCKVCEIIFPNTFTLFNHKKLHSQIYGASKAIDKLKGEQPVIHENTEGQGFSHLVENLTRNETARKQVKRRKNYKCKLCQNIFLKRRTLFLHKKLHFKINENNDASKAIEQQKGEQPVIHENTEGLGFSHLVENLTRNETARKQVKRRKNYKCKLCPNIFLNRRTLFLHKKLHFKINENNDASNAIEQQKREQPVIHENIEAQGFNHVVEEIVRNDGTAEKECENALIKDHLVIKNIYQCKVCHKFCHNSYALSQHEKQHSKLKDKNLKSEGTKQHKNDKQYSHENSVASGSSILIEDSPTSEPVTKQCKVVINHEKFKIRKLFQCKICHMFCNDSDDIKKHECKNECEANGTEELEDNHKRTNIVTTETDKKPPSSITPSIEKRKVYSSKKCEEKVHENFKEITHTSNAECSASYKTKSHSESHFDDVILKLQTQGQLTDKNKVENQKFPCDVCGAVFLTPKNLRKHIYRQNDPIHFKKQRAIYEERNEKQVLKLTNNAEISDSNEINRQGESHSDNKKEPRQGQFIDKNKIIIKKFPCDACGAVFSSERNLKIHVFLKTDSRHFKKQCVMNTEEHNKKQLKTTVKCYINTKKGSKTVQNHNQLVLKSILYKCQKCDVHFLFAKTAQNHVQHMDMLVNWKCTICLRIFKIHDKYLHLIQHHEENEIHVYNLTSEELSKVLYNCPKCTLHFGEDEFLYHYNLCGNSLIFQSLYCRICDILIEQKTMLDHAYHHKEGLATDFTIVVTQVVNSTDTKKLSNRLPVLKMYYCKDCDCYVSKAKLHSKSSCSNRKKYICKLCGLPIPIEYMPDHGKFHTVHGNFKISNFIFLDIKNGNQITPPIPSFPRCESCLVHFTSKAAIQRHICGEKVSTLCTICDKKFTYVALRLHVPFHSISSTDNEKELNSTTETLKTVNDAKESISNTNNLNQSSIDPSILEEICSRKLVISIPRLEFPLPDHNEISFTKPSPRIVFCCNNCELAFDAYDRVVEHCQKHYENKGNLFSGEICKLCNLTFETKCSYNHSLLKNDNVDYVIVKFDIDFFMQVNPTWVAHVFETIDSDHKDKILNNSIYKSEARIKMHIVQEGSPSLTIYQCDKCGCCVVKNFYNHTKNSCFHIRKHLCNTCGLAFVSYLTKEQHEDIHRTSDVGLKDYRLVQFNREEDKDYHESVISALNKKYVLYQCRNCNGIVNITKFMKHICKPLDLHKCHSCGLLIYNEDLDIHNKKHYACNNYLPENMKILLCGQIVEERQKKFLPTFTGFVCDYTFYKCANCHTCVRDFQRSNHICTDNKIKCNLCDLYFLTNFHKKLHKQDTDFTKANINIIEFKLKQNKVIENSSQINMKLDSLVSQSVSSIDIYKCPICPLHFLDKPSTFAHLKSCNPKLNVSKQTCSKCGIMFTSKILFNHLIKHHGNDNKHCKFNIIDVDKINTIFKCSICILHFTTYSEAYEHTIQCDGFATGVKCTNCELIISPACFQDHNKGHSKIYKYTKFIMVQAATPKAIEDMTSKFNEALIKRLDLAKDSLSKLNFSTFSNVLYSCDVCNVYFIDIISIYSHILSETHDSVIHELRDNCKICNFDFLLSDLTSHVFVHHKKWGLEKNNFVIIDSNQLF